MVPLVVVVLHEACDLPLQRCDRRVQLPGDDIPRVIIQDARQVVPPSVDDLEVREVRLPQLMDSRRRIGELLRCIG